jgi:phosphoglycerate dehydrogenase-like enzyme
MLTVVLNVCVPSDAERELLGAPALVWDGSGAPPDGIEAVEFYVASYMAPPPDAQMLSRMPRLRVVQVLSAGYERWVPMLPPGVTLCNGRGVHGGSTAELAVGGLISIVRELPRMLEQQRAHNWNPVYTEGMDGKRVLILGAGDIARRVAATVATLGAVSTLVGRTAREGVRASAELPALLPQHDAVVIAMPLTEQTRHLVDAEFLAALPDGAIVVNVSRGAIVDTEALLEQANAGRLRAFLDVSDPEPLPADHRLWDAPGVLITPHVGGGTSGWPERAYALVREQYARFTAGQSLRNVVLP